MDPTYQDPRTGGLGGPFPAQPLETPAPAPQESTTGPVVSSLDPIVPPVAPPAPTFTPSEGAPPMPPLPPEVPEEPKSNKKWLLLGVVGLLLVATIGGGIFLASKLGPKLNQQTQVEPVAEVSPTPEVAAATVSYLGGSAWSTSGGIKSAIAQDNKVSEGAIIETGEDAKLTLAFDGGSILRLGPATKLTLTSVNPLDMKFLEDSGVLYAYVDKGGTSKFTVTSGDVVVMAEGTAFSVEKDDLVAVNVYDSTVSITKGEIQALVDKDKRWIEGSTKTLALNTTELQTDNFLQWALEDEIARVEAQITSQVTPPADKEDKDAYLASLKALGIEKKELIKEAFLKTTTGTISTITLTGAKNSDGTVKFSWTANGLADNGYKIIWSATAAKPYPGDKRTYNPLFGYEKTLGPIKPGTSWYFRVCAWTGTTCGVYSNELTFSF